MNGKEKLIRRIKDAGQEIIDRAEEMVAADKITELYITVRLPAVEDEADQIEWTTAVYNNNQIKRYFEGDF